jgi:hypothetical protein
MSLAPSSSPRPEPRPNDLHNTSVGTRSSGTSETLSTTVSVEHARTESADRFEARGGGDDAGGVWNALGAPELNQPRVREVLVAASEREARDAFSGDVATATHARAAKAAEATGERLAITRDNDESSIGDIVRAEAAAGNAKAALGSFSSVRVHEEDYHESEATVEPATVGQKPLAEPQLSFGIDPQNGKYLGTSPGELPEVGQVLENIAFGRSQRPDPELEGLSEDAMRELEVGQQLGASIISNAIVFGLGSNVNELAAKIAPPALQYPIALAGKVALGRFVNPIAQEGSDIYSDYRGEPNVVPGPGWVSVENLGDVVPSATSIVAGEAAKIGAKAALLGTASAIGISIPEPVTTIAGLAGAIYVGSEVFVATDNVLPDVLPKETFMEDESPTVPPTWEVYEAILDRYENTGSHGEESLDNAPAAAALQNAPRESFVSVLVAVPERILDFVDDAAGSLVRFGQHLINWFDGGESRLTEVAAVTEGPPREPIPYGDDNIAVPVFRSVRTSEVGEVSDDASDTSDDTSLIGGLPRECLIELWMAPYIVRLLALGVTNLCQFEGWSPEELDSYVEALESDGQRADSAVAPFPMILHDDAVLQVVMPNDEDEREPLWFM